MPLPSGIVMTRKTELKMIAMILMTSPMMIPSNGITAQTCFDDSYHAACFRRTIA